MGRGGRARLDASQVGVPVTKALVVAAALALGPGCLTCESGRWHKALVAGPASTSWMNYGTPDAPIWMSIDTPEHVEVQDVCDTTP